MPRFTVIAGDEEWQKIKQSIKNLERPAGEKLLLGKAIHGANCETWIYLPHDNSWLNLTKKAEFGKEKDVPATLGVYSFIMEDVPKASFYSIHTKEAELQTYKDTKVGVATREAIRHLAGIDLAIPSINYMQFYVDYSKEHPKTEYDFNIVHPHGITMFKFKNKNKDYNAALEKYSSLIIHNGLMGRIRRTAAESRPVRDSIDNIVDHLNWQMKRYAVMHYVPTQFDFSEDEAKAYCRELNKN